MVEADVMEEDENGDEEGDDDDDDDGEMDLSNSMLSVCVYVA